MRRLLLAYILVAMMLSGCNSTSLRTTTSPSFLGTLTPTLVPTAISNVSATNTTIATSGPTTSMADLILIRQRQIDELTRSENTWYAQHIINYRLAVSLQTQFGAPPMATIETTVINGSITNVNRSFTPGCASIMGFDVPYLLREARRTINNLNCVTTITYDGQYGFPRLVDCYPMPDVTDGRYTISVNLFTVLP